MNLRDLSNQILNKKINKYIFLKNVQKTGKVANNVFRACRHFVIFFTLLEDKCFLLNLAEDLPTLADKKGPLTKNSCGQGINEALIVEFFQKIYIFV